MTRNIEKFHREIDVKLGRKWRTKRIMIPIIDERASSSNIKANRNAGENLWAEQHLGSQINVNQGEVHNGFLKFKTLWKNFRVTDIVFPVCSLSLFVLSLLSVSDFFFLIHYLIAILKNLTGENSKFQNLHICAKNLIVQKCIQYN